MPLFDLAALLRPDGSTNPANFQPMQNNTQHTPGPWEVSRLQTSEESTQVITSEGWHLCNVELDPHEANARLIAAAPDLLAALQKIVSLWDENRYDGPVAPMNDAKLAIAKATGEDVA